MQLLLSHLSRTWHPVVVFFFAGAVAIFGILASATPSFSWCSCCSHISARLDTQLPFFFSCAAAVVCISAGPVNVELLVKLTILLYNGVSARRYGDQKRSCQVQGRHQAWHASHGTAHHWKCLIDFLESLLLLLSWSPWIHSKFDHSSWMYLSFLVTNLLHHSLVPELIFIMLFYVDVCKHGSAEELYLFGIKGLATKYF